jgi:uncharacterized protein YdaU (DUF1376 family)
MSLSYFPLFPDDFEADTAHLTLAEDGAYNRLLRLCWRTPGCSIPTDRDWIYRRMRATTDEDRRVIDIVLDEFFTENKQRLSNARLMREYVAANQKHERRKNAGKKGGLAKPLKNNKNGSSNAKSMLKQPEPEPEPEPEPKRFSNENPPHNPPPEQIAIDMFNAVAERAGLSKVQKLTAARMNLLKARLKDCGGIDGWHVAMAEIENSTFLTGVNDRGWKATFDFVVRESSFAKLMEGQYRRNRPMGVQDQRMQELADWANEGDDDDQETADQHVDRRISAFER